MVDKSSQRSQFDIIDQILKEYNERLSRVEDKIRRLSNGVIEKFNELATEI